MIPLRSALAGILTMLAAATASAQTFPTVPNHTVIGRIGQAGDTGPSQAIPFTTLAPQLGVHTLPEIYAADPAYGVKCDGVTDDAPALQLAVNTADGMGGAIVVLPAGTCLLYETVYLNKWAASGILTVPGMKLKGQGKGITILDTRVANGYAISVNPAWQAAHKALAGISATTGGSGALATNTYYVQLTVSDPAGNQIDVTSAKSISVNGPGGRIAITLPPINTGYTYNAYCDTATTPAHFCVVGGINATGLGGGQTINFDALGSAQAIPTSKLAVWQEADISNLSITNSTAAASASGIRYFKVGYAKLTNVYMKGLTGDGLNLPNYTGDIDGSFFVTIDHSKFDTIAGWCVNAAGAALELSNLLIQNTEFNLCGTLPANLNTNVTISAIPNGATPIVTTATAHNLLAGDQIYISGVTGMSLTAGWYRVGTAVTSASFNLVDLNGVPVDTTALGAYNASSGTVSLSWRPPKWNATTLTTDGSGGIAWLGLIATIRNSDCTQCNNTFIYSSENGTSDNLTLEGIDAENTAGKGFYIAGVANGAWNQGECLSAVGLGSTISCVQFGTGFAGGGVQNFKISNIKVRNNVAPATAFEQFANTNIGATFQDTVRVANIYWASFDAANQTRFNGLKSDPIPGQVLFSISAKNTAKLIPVGYGGTLPLHPKANGEWVPFHVPAAGVTGAVTGGLTPATSYNCYAYNSAATSFPYALGFECVSTATALDQGYNIKSGDASRTFIGTATTDGAGDFQTTGAQTSWYPPTGASTTGNFSIGGNLNVTGNATIGGSIIDGNGILATNIVAPAMPASGTTRIYVDSTQKVLTFKNDAGTVGNAVVPSTCGANLFGTSISAAGVFGCTQPTFSNLLTGTAPAFTLGGTISGGGNQINNVIIGASTPLAGSFTTLTASTSMTSPIHYGGSAAGSTATINGTSSGSPSNAYLVLQTNGQFVGIGNATPNTLLDVDANLTSNATNIVATSLVHVQAADGASVGQEWLSFGAGASAGTILVGGVAGGTSASPTPPTASQYMYNMRGYGYNSGWQSGGLWIIQTAEAWSAGHQGTLQDWYTTPVASTTIALAMRLNASGGLYVGASTDPGIGKVGALNGFQSGANAGLSVTKTVRASGGAADCTLIYTGGILTGGSC